VAHAVSSPVPLRAEVMEMMQALRVIRCDKEDYSALAKYYERLYDITIES